MTTRIDEAFAVMHLSDSDAARLRFYEAILESEIFLLLDQTSDGQTAKPRTFDTTEGQFAMGFDTELRLVEFAGDQAEFVALSGRNLVTLLSDTGLGLALNFGAPSEQVLPIDIVEWMAHEEVTPEEVEARPEEILPPSLPAEAIAVIDRKLAGMQGYAQHAYLADARYDGGTLASLLAFVNVVDGSEQAVASAIAEALHFSGFEAVSIDVIFLDSADPISAVFANHGLRFDLPKPDPAAHLPNPDVPPRLV
ncbi:MAG: SseB family protein [Pseudomonadota bacterium]